MKQYLPVLFLLLSYFYATDAILCSKCNCNKKHDKEISCSKCNCGFREKEGTKGKGNLGVSLRNCDEWDISLLSDYIDYLCYILINKNQNYSEAEKQEILSQCYIKKKIIEQFSTIINIETNLKENCYTVLYVDKDFDYKPNYDIHYSIQKSNDNEITRNKPCTALLKDKFEKENNKEDLKSEEDPQPNPKTDYQEIQQKQEEKPLESTEESKDEQETIQEKSEDTEEQEIEEFSEDETENTEEMIQDEDMNVEQEEFTITNDAPNFMNKMNNGPNSFNSLYPQDNRNVYSDEELENVIDEDTEYEDLEHERQSTRRKKRPKEQLFKRSSRHQQDYDEEYDNQSNDDYSNDNNEFSPEYREDGTYQHPSEINGRNADFSNTQNPASAGDFVQSDQNFEEQEEQYDDSVNLENQNNFSEESEMQEYNRVDEERNFEEANSQVLQENPPYQRQEGPVNSSQNAVLQENVSERTVSELSELRNESTNSEMQAESQYSSSEESENALQRENQEMVQQTELSRDSTVDLPLDNPEIDYAQSSSNIGNGDIDNSPNPEIPNEDNWKFEENVTDNPQNTENITSYDNADGERIVIDGEGLRSSDF